MAAQDPGASEGPKDWQALDANDAWPAASISEARCGPVFEDGRTQFASMKGGLHSERTVGGQNIALAFAEHLRPRAGQSVHLRCAWKGDGGVFGCITAADEPELFANCGNASQSTSWRSVYGFSVSNGVHNSDPRPPRMDPAHDFVMVLDYTHVLDDDGSGGGAEQHGEGEGKGILSVTCLETPEQEDVWYECHGSERGIVCSEEVPLGSVPYVAIYNGTVLTVKETMITGRGDMVKSARKK